MTETRPHRTDQRAIRILARSLARDLPDAGYLVALASALIDEAVTKLRATPPA